MNGQNKIKLVSFVDANGANIDGGSRIHSRTRPPIPTPIPAPTLPNPRRVQVKKSPPGTEHPLDTRLVEKVEKIICKYEKNRYFKLTVSFAIPIILNKFCIVINKL